MKIKRISLVCFMLLLFVPSMVYALDWSVKLEPGLSAALSAPQSRLFDLGGSVTAKFLFALGKYVDVGPAAGFTGLSASESNPKTSIGTAWQLGGGFRIKRPHEYGKGLNAVSPWLDTDMLYVRTDALNRFGFSVAGGFSFPIGKKRHVWLGPFARYFQIMQPERVGFDNRDAKIITAGLSLEVASKSIQQVQSPVKPVFLICPATRCGTCKDCPTIKPIEPIMAPAIPALNVQVQFDWDDYSILVEEHSNLDKVIKVLTNNQSYSIVIEGHASSEGSDEHNQVLSENRAKSVSAYLESYGINNSRISVKGFGSTVPIEPNDTSSGRVVNRRVNFRLEQMGGVK